MGNCCSNPSNEEQVDKQPPPSTQEHVTGSPQAALNNNNNNNQSSDMRDYFITARDGMLTFKDCEGAPTFRFASLNSPELTDGHMTHLWEIEDTMRTIAGLGEMAPVRVTRTYCLRIKSVNHGRGHIMGWDDSAQQWILDEQSFAALDLVLAKAAEFDVRLIIPIINQDQGPNANWVGDFSDLCKMRYNLPDYAAGQQVPWFFDRGMIDSYKILITQLMERVNTVNGRRYGSDPTVLAWQTGNEMRCGAARPAPGAWTHEICGHIKSLAPNTMTADGSYAKADTTSGSFDEESLRSPNVDMYSSHYYSDGEAKRAKKDAERVRQHNKLYIATEYGFFKDIGVFYKFLEDGRKGGWAGSLIWSLRPHSGHGGFKTHIEDHINRSYHCPGHQPPLPDSFDQREQPIVQMIRHETYALNNQKVPDPPVPCTPTLWKETRNNCHGLVFQGAAWAMWYEVWSGPNCVMPNVRDSVPAGELFIPVPGAGLYKVRGMSAQGVPGNFSDEVQA